MCAFTAVEPCLSWRVSGNRQTQKLDLLRGMRQCLFVYHYWIDAVFGFMSARLQTWFPFALYIYRNGRAWLARQMDQAGLRYQRHDNCFPWIEDFPRAQALMDEQLKTDWTGALDACAARAHPLLAQLCANYPMQYGRPVRALPFECSDRALLTAVNRGEFTINGLRNRDLQTLLFAAVPETQAEARRRSAAVSRKLRLLRAHGIIQKLPHTHRYHVTSTGRLLLNAVLSAQRTTTQQLTTLAA